MMVGTGMHREWEEDAGACQGMAREEIWVFCLQTMHTCFESTAFLGTLACCPDTEEEEI